jgi:hypothetical protein
MLRGLIKDILTPKSKRKCPGGKIKSKGKGKGLAKGKAKGPIGRRK